MQRAVKRCEITEGAALDSVLARRFVNIQAAAGIFTKGRISSTRAFDASFLWSIEEPLMRCSSVCRLAIVLLLGMACLYWPGPTSSRQADGIVSSGAKLELLFDGGVVLTEG